MKTIKPLILSAGLLFSLIAGTQDPAVSYQVDPAGFSKLISSDSGIQLLDVRTAEEFGGGHLANALNIDWYDSTFSSQVAALDKSKTVLVYCRSGKRSASAAEMMRGMGFSKVVELKGGIAQWRLEKYPETGNKANADEGMSKAQFEALKNTDKLLLVDFYAEWCQPCRKMKPYLDEIAADLKDKVIVIRINADENRKLCEENGITALPVLQLYKDKDLIWSNIGYIDREAILSHLKGR